MAYFLVYSFYFKNRIFQWFLSLFSFLCLKTIQVDLLVEVWLAHLKRKTETWLKIDQFWQIIYSAFVIQTLILKFENYSNLIRGSSINKVTALDGKCVKDLWRRYVSLIPKNDGGGEGSKSVQYYVMWRHLWTTPN